LVKSQGSGKKKAKSILYILQNLPEKQFSAL